MLALYGGDKKAAAEGLEIKEETLGRIVSEK
jgi:hypothetical protein